MAALVTFEQVTKRFGAFTAVDSLSLEIREREFFALRPWLRQDHAAACLRI
jgi:ABC-type Fe3+/spermidine/putrescine transport system ATPase subunit